VYDVALDRAVDEYAVADQFVVVEVAADDRRAEVNDDVTASRDPYYEVNDDAGDVDDGDAEQYAADARTPLDAHVLLTTHVRRT